MFEKYTQNSRFANYPELEKYLAGLGLFHMNFGLERVQKALNVFFPQGLPFKAAQVIGTNGKGSTSHFLASIAGAHDIKDGLFTSPHLLTMRERVLVSGRMLPEEEWTLCANIVDAVQSKNPKEALTYFEFIFVLALVAFCRADVEFAVLEAGLGGEFDATSAVFAEILIFTPINFDHQNILGETLTEIAGTKAEAIKLNQILITAEQNPTVLAVLKAKASERGNKLLKPAQGQKFNYPLGLLGYHQKENAQLALTAFSLLANKYGWILRKPALLRGFKRAHIPGRMQLIGPMLEHPPLLLDGAHNIHSFEALEKNLTIYGLHPRAIIFSCMNDKNLGTVLPKLATWTEGPIYIPPVENNPRAASPQKLAKEIGPKAHPVQNIKEALKLAYKAPAPAASKPGARASLPDYLQSPVLICGSLYLLGDFFKLHPGLLEPA